MELIYKKKQAVGIIAQSENILQREFVPSNGRYAT